MFLQQIIKSITSGWKLIVVFILVAVCVSLVISATMIPVYQSRATFVIAPNKNLPSSRDVVSAFTALDTLNIFSTYTDILLSERVVQEANKVVGLGDEELVIYKRSAEMNPESIILGLMVEGPDPQTAAILTNEMGKYGIRFINAYFSVFEIDFLDQAVASMATHRPRTYRGMSIAAGIGLAVGLVFVILKELMEIPLSRFMQKFSLDSESMAYTKVHILRSLGNMKTQGTEWPVTFILIKMLNFMQVYEVLPRFSKKEITSEIVRRLKRQIKGADLIGRWDDSIFSIVLPRTPAKVTSIIIERIENALSEPIMYGVENSELLELEQKYASTICKNADEFETLVSSTESALKIRK
jgi:capsular polysaccharide biosynthesis protein/GGDEF domain-containing protein